MPIYEYKCENCGHRFEKIRKHIDDRIVFCEKCLSPKTKKLISLSSFRLRGNGWYETDFKHRG